MTPTLKTLLAATLSAGVLVIGAGAAQAQRHGDIVVAQASPPPRPESVPAPRPGYQWSPGYWQAQGNRQVWHDGSWVRDRPGQHDTRPTRQQRDGHRQPQRGGWDSRDDDHDGVPNIVDPDQSPIQK